VASITPTSSRSIVRRQDGYSAQVDIDEMNCAFAMWVQGLIAAAALGRRKQLLDMPFRTTPNRWSPTATPGSQLKQCARSYGFGH
jgi:hypothetical protein